MVETTSLIIMNIQKFHVSTYAVRYHCNQLVLEVKPTNKHAPQNNEKGKLYQIFISLQENSQTIRHVHQCLVSFFHIYCGVQMCFMEQNL